ncbi:pyridoxamine 5'-phosphate oxidase family protein [Myxococcota bacterium]|nr:pyridoxamine 5'-phosphate oxidase family protein [Myxococcota bacterium]
MPSTNDQTKIELDVFSNEARVPLRLGVLDADGGPRVLSLWYLWEDGALWCATSPRAWVVERLRADPRCGFELAGDAPPYRGIRGRARAALVPARGEAVLGALVDRYLGTCDTPFARWLLARGTDEMAIRIVPEKISRWDYSRRMT